MLTDFSLFALQSVNDGRDARVRKQIWVAWARENAAACAPPSSTVRCESECNQ